MTPQSSNRRARVRFRPENACSGDNVYGATKIGSFPSEKQRQPVTSAHPQPHPLPRVLLLVETSTAFGLSMLQGIGRYVREHGPWSFFLEQRGLEEPPSRRLKRWRGEGIIARTATRSVADLVKAAGVPVVELLGDQADGPAKVLCDSTAAGRLAAEHLLGCGLRNFGFFAFGEAWWIAMYRDGFQQTLGAQGHACDVYQVPSANRRLLPKWRDAQEPGVTAWLRSLPRPAGVFAPSVEYAARLLDICRNIDLAVPEQIAVFTAPNDEALCIVTTPPLSAVEQGSRRVGYEAAALLGRMMAGEPAPEHPLWLPPSHVVVRRSTEVLAIEDDDTAQAVRFIREHACEGIGVPQVSNAIGLSRRVLERRFQQYLGRTPKDEILRVKIDRVKFLLSQTHMAIENIAHNSGFPSFKNLAKLFLREAGITPLAYRKANRIVCETPPEEIL